ncbi:HEPN domain-containing protein [Sporomusa sphaeroides]|uniref:HEPN domain-containing protein n=1 Tax=Sporomusa sphaeroides DSM 2875 TaxID=1337886 RepID=A0ABP2C5Y0_9FIRM|nr:HEPN domain-containing protein [Sporomusa sphaeroides]OLS58285.1 hypothetical protein SPSPH_18210 [Sporomusa sphaeroides DSM 2875]CVK17528.1 hypothetical protein SSPH_00162 [Sporomusa sphaeroides DSM 2875]
MSTFDWSNYLTFAQEICGKNNGQNPCQEAKMRCAISRAYYSAFCNARNFLKDNGVDLPDDAKVHEVVKSQFNKSANETYQQIGENLNRLRIARNKADYNNKYYINNRAATNLVGEAIKSISYCETVISKLHKLSQDKQTSQAK